MSRYTLTISCVLNMYGGCHEHEILPESGRASLTHGSREMHRRRDRTQDTAWSTGSVTVNGHCGRQEALCKTKLDKSLGLAQIGRPLVDRLAKALMTLTRAFAAERHWHSDRFVLYRPESPKS
jgi:hypothetical protein